MNINLSKRTVCALHSFNESDNLYTFSLLERGGPVISGENFEETKAKFEAALDIAFALRNLFYFDDISLVEKAGFIRSNSTSNNRQIHYQALEAA